MLPPSQPVDVWSCGVMLYVMLLYAFPFDARPGDTEADPLSQGLKQIQVCIIIRVVHTLIPHLQGMQQIQVLIRVSSAHHPL